MSNLIIGNPRPDELAIKRLYPPFDLASVCPTCGETVEYDDDYLSYPKLHQPTTIPFYHVYTRDDGVEEDHTWDVPCRIALTITPNDSGATSGAGDEEQAADAGGATVGWFKVRSDGEGQLWAMNIPGFGAMVSTRWRGQHTEGTQLLPGAWITKQRTWTTDESEAHYIDATKPAVPWV